MSSDGFKPCYIDIENLYFESTFRAGTSSSFLNNFTKCKLFHCKHIGVLAILCLINNKIIDYGILIYRYRCQLRSICVKKEVEVGM